MALKHISLVANNVGLVQARAETRTQVLVLRSGRKAASRRMAAGEIGAFMVRPAMRSIVRRRRFAPPHQEA
ncbi:hypothetical protein TSA1_23910 [Bradyrhizobium nitroreducens]|uniref:Uncharacterized protein n=1 Tax=Bradyrhizobium nitroreducens TaxID=709803 RepID=A0A2M6UG21_9BRAD|nr:hypothetical protein TSA1_23910 [Bradyrhizobium nitroreducens]